MKVGYARVSTNGQSLDVQLEALAAAGVDKTFEEKRSGKSTDDREQLRLALEFVREGDCLVITRLDRLARSVFDLHAIAQELQRKDADLLVLDQQGIDTRTAAGKLLFSTLGAVAEFERAIINERTHEGRIRARERGVKFGRRPALSAKEIVQLQREFAAMRAGNGPSAADLAARFGIARSSLYRICAAASDAS